METFSIKGTLFGKYFSNSTTTIVEIRPFSPTATGSFTGKLLYYDKDELDRETPRVITTWSDSCGQLVDLHDNSCRKVLIAELCSQSLELRLYDLQRFDLSEQERRMHPQIVPLIGIVYVASRTTNPSLDFARKFIEDVHAQRETEKLRKYANFFGSLKFIS